MQDMPNDWLEKVIAGSLPFPPERHDNLVELLHQSTNQIDLIYRCKLGKPYIGGEGQEEFPLELCMADAHRYPLKRSLFTEGFLLWRPKSVWTIDAPKRANGEFFAKKGASTLRSYSIFYRHGEMKLPYN